MTTLSQIILHNLYFINENYHNDKIYLIKYKLCEKVCDNIIYFVIACYPFCTIISHCLLKSVLVSYFTFCKTANVSWLKVYIIINDNFYCMNYNLCERICDDTTF